MTQFLNGWHDEMGLLEKHNSMLQLLFDFLAEFEEKTGIRLILMPIVDDLDRCPPGKIIEGR